ncbi:MAG: LysR substrate-binding domain-containing protein [Acidimicrobiia bacterium]|nr:LysR substrate-binding domain-containing protein [Acidimicrobiia bacterium]
MNDIQLREVDLNLLVVLDVLLEERSVTGAAERLDLTPSAVSHALKRLRELFDDELLLRDGRRMRPTVRAEGLAETLPRVLQQVARTIATPEPFEPTTSTRTFRLAAPDFIASLVPALLQDVRNAAPGIRVELAPYSATAVRELAEGRYDALIAPDGIRDEDLRGQPLGTWPWAVYGREGHPAFADWSAEAWSDYPHLRVHTSGVRGRSPIDRRASQLGIRRVVGAMVPTFSMAAPILAQTDLLLTVPSVAIGNTAIAFHLDHREIPFDLPPMGLSLFRSAAEGDEPGVRWFLERVATAFSKLDEDQ